MREAGRAGAAAAHLAAAVLEGADLEVADDALRHIRIRVVRKSRACARDQAQERTHGGQCVRTWTTIPKRARRPSEACTVGTASRFLPLVTLLATIAARPAAAAALPASFSKENRVMKID